MARINGSIEVLAPIEQVYQFCTDVANLPPLFPKEIRVEVVRRPDPPLRTGAEILLKFHRSGLVYPWESVVTACEPCRVFEDVQTRGPMKRWVSCHVFEATPRGTRVIHVVDYDVHFGILGRICGVMGMHSILRRVFQHVHEATKEAIERQLDSPPESGYNRLADP